MTDTDTGDACLNRAEEAGSGMTQPESSPPPPQPRSSKPSARSARQPSTATSKTPGSPTSATATRPATVADTRERFRRDRWEAAFLDDYKLWGNKAQAAKAAGIDVKTVNRHLRDDPAFADIVRAAHDEFVEQLEMDLVRLGRGHRNVIALIARLKAEKPGKYHDKLQVDAAVKQLNVNVFASEEEARSLLQQMLAEATDITRERLAGAHVIDVKALPAPERLS